MGEGEALRQLNFTGRSWELMERRQPRRAVRAGGSLAVGTIVQRRKRKIISQFHHQKIKVHISPDGMETVVLNLLLWRKKREDVSGVGIKETPPSKKAEQIWKQESST